MRKLKINISNAKNDDGSGYIELRVPLQSDNQYNMDSDDNRLKNLSENIVNSIIPEIVDNEKIQLLPAIVDGERFIPVKRINFNLHFRDRMNDEWSTSDDREWNGYTVKRPDPNRKDEVMVPIRGYEDGKSDNVKYLGFTEDDIKYQKKKVKMSFLRLMFYSDSNPVNSDLLSYSTVFMDSGYLYGRYNRIIGSKHNCFDDDVPEDMRLTSQMYVVDKYDRSKSSEGFYLYMFPFDVNDEKTIYMKVEFNHAGYGKKVSLMMPTYDGRVVGTESSSFPCNFMKEDDNGMISTDMEKYFSSIMVPVKIRYDRENDRYVYVFPEGTASMKDNSITLNFFEPRKIWKK